MNSADDPCVVLFASVDLIGSTAYKNRASARTGNGARQQEWYNAFASFYFAFYSSLNKKARSLENVHNDRKGFIFLKALGDELIFYQYIANHSEAVALVQVFRDALREFNNELKDMLNLPLGVKGAMWIAGFPINNAQIDTPPPHKIDADGLAKGIDFLGPSIDTGFRISKFADQRRLVVGVDLALLLTADEEQAEGVTFYFDGLQQLKGILNDKPYPIIWIACEEESDEERLIGIEKQKCNIKQLHDYCQKYIGNSSSFWLIRPYFAQGSDPLFNDPPETHKRIWAANRLEDLKSKKIDDSTCLESSSISDVSAEQLLERSVLNMPALNNPEST